MASQLRLGALSGLGHDLDDVARLQDRLERGRLAVDPDPGAVEPDLGVDAEGEIEGRGARRQGDDLPLGREDVDLLRDEVDLEVLEEFLGVFLLLEELDHFPQPLQPPVLPDQALRRPRPCTSSGRRSRSRRGSCMSRVRIWISKVCLVLGDDGRVEGLVEVGLGHGDEIAEALGDAAAISGG